MAAYRDWGCKGQGTVYLKIIIRKYVLNADFELIPPDCTQCSLGI